MKNVFYLLFILLIVSVTTIRPQHIPPCGGNAHGSTNNGVCCGAMQLEEPLTEVGVMHDVQ